MTNDLTTAEGQLNRMLWSKWRVGRKVGRTVYCQLGSEPSDTDPLIGVMDTVGFARSVVKLHNEALQDGRELAEASPWKGVDGLG